MPLYVICSKNCKQKKRVFSALAANCWRETTYPSMPRWTDRIPGERGSASNLCLLPDFLYMAELANSHSTCPTSSARAPWPDPIRDRLRWSAMRRWPESRQLRRSSSGEISAALDDHSTQKHPSATLRQTSKSMRCWSERWSSSTSHAPSINALSLAKHETEIKHSREPIQTLLARATGIKRQRTAALLGLSLSVIMDW